MIRKPAVAGIFYENQAKMLKKTIEDCFMHELGPGNIPQMGNTRKLKGAIVPHAGYIYSGPIAAHSYYSIVEDGFPETFVILCPNHTGLGTGVSISSDEQWNTPLGNIDVDTEFAEYLFKNSDIMDLDNLAHLREHSCEVQLPFLQYFSEDFKIVPITMGFQDVNTVNDIANAINDAKNSLNRDIIVLASTDFTHYKTHEIASKQDHYLLDSISKFDIDGVYSKIQEHDITICGYGPVASALLFAKNNNANTAELLKYATSGDTSKDYSSVVGYASEILY